MTPFALCFISSLFSAQALLTQWKVVAVDITAEDDAKMVECINACDLAVNNMSLTGLRAVDAKAAECVNTQAFKDNNCNLAVSVSVLSKTDTDSMVCASAVGLSYSEAALTDCGYKMTKIGWTRATINSKTGPVDLSNGVPVTLFFKEFNPSVDINDLCTTDYWTDKSTEGVAAKVFGPSLSNTTPAVSAVSIVSEDGLDAGLQWWLPQDTTPFVITNIDRDSANNAQSTITVKQTYKPGMGSACDNGGVMGRVAGYSLIPIALFVLAF